MKNYKIHILHWTIICLFLCTQSGIAQEINENVNYYNYSIENGLPSAETYDVFQDSKGYLWIGTDNGVVRFDGVNFKTFTTQDGLTDNTVFKIYEDYRGRIWFITYNRKLCIMENGQISPYPFNQALIEESKHISYGNTITEFSVSIENEIYIDFAHRSSRDIASIYVDKNGVCRTSALTPGVLRFKKIQYSTHISSLINSCIEQVNQNPKDWNRIIHTKNFLAIRVHKVDSILYIGTQTGLYICSLEQKKVLKHILPSQYITSVTHDFEGGLWCSSLHNGVFYVPNTSVHSFALKSDTRSQINAILPSEQSFLFCFNKNLGNYSFNPRTNQLTPLKESIKLKNLESYELNQGIKMVNTIYLEEIYADINCLLLIKPNNYLLASSTFGLRHVLVENTSNLVFTEDFKPNEGSLNNQFFYKDKTHYYQAPNSTIYQSKTISDTIPRVLKILKINEHTALLGTLSGLYTINLSSFEITKSDILGVNDETRIQDIIKLETGELLFATKGKGIISSLKGEINFLKITHKGKTNTINQLHQDSHSHRVFTASNFGVYELTKENNKWEYYPILSQLDGPELSDFRQIRTNKHLLFLANNNRVSYLSLNELRKKIVAPKLYIHSLQTQNQKININNKITLPYDSNFFDIRYQAISFKSQNNFTYFYRLDQKSPWRTTTNSVLTFNSLDPGEYQFEIKAANAFGVESTIKKLDFEILTPYWLTWWFLSLTVLAILVILSVISYRTVSFYKNQTAIQRKLNELQVLSLQSKMSPHFIFNSLNSIQNYILTNNKMAANEYLIEFSRLIRSILKNSEKSTILLSKELEILNLYVELEKKRLRKPFLYHIELKGNIDLNLCEIPSLLIQPYVENSIWHGQVYNNPNGEIKIIIEQKDESLFITISDNGIGVKNAAELKQQNNPDHTSIGTKTTKNRIELISELNAQMSKVVISETSSSHKNTEFIGTTIQFSIPYIVNSDKK